MKSTHRYPDESAVPPSIHTETSSTSTQASFNLARRTVAALADALEQIFTPRASKRSAAIFLRNALLQAPMCRFCGNAGSNGVELHRSLDPTTWICTYCAWYIAHRRDIERREFNWAQLKDFAP